MRVRYGIDSLDIYRKSHQLARDFVVTRAQSAKGGPPPSPLFTVVTMATGNPSQMDLNCLLLWQGEPGRGAMPPPSPTTSSCGDVMTHLSSSGDPSPDASQAAATGPPAASTVNVPLASLISLTDDSSVLTDSCPSVTLSEASVTWAPTQAQARHAGAECRVLNGCGASGEGGAVGGDGVEVVGGEPRHPSLVLKKAEWKSGGLRPASQPTTGAASPRLPSAPLKASSPAGTQSQVPLTSSGAAAAPPNESKSDASRFPSKTSGDKKQGDLAPVDMSCRAHTYTSKACSPTCAENFAKLYLQVTETKHQLSTLTVKVCIPFMINCSDFSLLIFLSTLIYILIIPQLIIYF